MTHYELHFSYPMFLYIGLPLVVILTCLRYKVRKGVVYSYPLASLLAIHSLVSRHPYKMVIALMRIVVLVMLTILLAKPQLIDPRTEVTIQGIDIMMVLDVSGSMAHAHHSDDERSRIDVAKEEAIRFVDKRNNDALGLVIFGNDALSRCPLTADKKIIKDIIRGLSIGVIDEQGTVLSNAILTAVNRLRQSNAKSKVIILLTDGAPSEHDTNPATAIAAAKALGIKIYTIGIGDDHEEVAYHPLRGLVSIKTADKQLLMRIAQETGGVFFEAKNPRDMRTIYDTIDSLEKTELRSPLFGQGIDWFMPLLWVVFIILLLEIILTSFVWFSV